MKVSELPNPIWSALDVFATTQYGALWHTKDIIQFPTDISPAQLSNMFTDREATAYIRVLNYLTDVLGAKLPSVIEFT